MNASSTEVQRLRRKALALVWAGELWNLVEAAVALSSGIGAGSVALLAFGLDSFIELFAGGVLIWHLSKEWRGAEVSQAAEERAHKLIGATFFALALFVLVQAAATLSGLLPRPEESLSGILLLLASAAVMSLLYVAKTRIARQLRSPALRAEAIESLVCDAQDLTLLLGLGLNALVGWWWADPLAALALIPFLVHEGLEPFAGEEEHAQQPA